METRVSMSLRGMIFLGLLLAWIFPSLSWAEVSSETIANFTSVPINLTENDVTPQVLINASNDHQLFFKAFNDYTDLDGDGLADTTYKHAITYYGYFDSSKCYDYSVANQRFEPKAATDAQNYCTGGNDGYWSGNFLNWLSMSRIDVIRKILFGGHRRVDTAVSTVLERAYLPHDAHSWAKYYGGNDLDKLTPFSAAGGHYTLADADLKQNGLTFCNTTDVNMGNYGNNTYSQEYTEPPLIKVARGNYSLWAGNERWQCTWDSGASYDNHAGVSNANDSAKSGINAFSGTPAWAARIGEGNYVARVQACVSGLIGNEKCKLYPGTDGVSGTADDNYKPIGLLQVYGDDNQMHFGMVAGTYLKHVSGGDLIRNMTSMTNEINVGTTGTFSKVAATAGGPIAGPAYNGAEGLINAWSLFRIVGYSNEDDGDGSNEDSEGTYKDGDSCPWGLSAFANISGSNVCTNWGNPFSEIYYQSVNYFAGGGVIGQYHSNSQTGIKGLPTPQGFTDPLTSANYCARLNVVNLSSSIPSYDADELDNVSYGPSKIWDPADLPGDKSSTAMTDVVGAGEGLHGHSYFVGEINVANQGDGEDQLCTAKTVNSLGGVGGVCPEAPRLQGSYRIAGLAYYAHTKDIRPASATGGRALTGTQKIDTYSVAMATAVPSVEILHPVTGLKAVTIMPACRNTSLTPNGNCTIVDFKIVSQNVAAGTGKFYINWEDSEQGGDYDQDMWGTLEYAINAGDGTISIKTQVIAQSTPNKMGFGYVISGTTNDGFHVHSGINGFAFTEAANVGNDCTDADGCNCRADTSQGACTIDGSSTKNYTLGVAAATLLKDPLWYASKWGGFIDSDGSGTPNLSSEWDKVVNATGTPGTDGIPDNYFYASNPSQLEDALNRVFLSILQRASSGTAAAVVSNNVSGVGALYQAYYEPLRQDALGNEASWLGTVQALWLDSYGYIREDDGDATLENYNTDRVIQLFYDEAENKTRVRRYISTKDDEFSPYSMQGQVTAYDAVTGIVTFTVAEISGAAGSGPFNDWTVYNLSASTTGASTTSASIVAVGGAPQTFAVTPATAWITVGDTVMVAHFDSTAIALEDVGTLWNARKLLNFSGADASIQRTFTVKADGAVNGGRFIKTWIDADRDSVVDAGEFVDFARTAITPANFGFFNLATEAEAENLTDYVRGKEIAGYRSRTIDYDGNGATEVMRLGDVVNSTPTIVGSPQEGFDLLYKDSSYAVFKKQYAKRRQMLYVGSNGGMLHALNGGFYDSTQKAFLVSGEKYDGVTPVVEHPLGAEIWAYTPMNLLPHLKWLKDLNYTHVYYVDGKPKVFDAKIFSVDVDHPGGWGTVLVVGMRLGGGSMTIDTAADGLVGDGTPEDNRAFRSAYIIMDITNPEAEPQLLAEVQVPDGTFSTSYPAAMTVKDKDPGLDGNKWFLIFGNGPTNMTTAESTTTAKFYAFDLGEIATPGSSTIVTPPAGCAQLAVGTGGSMKILSCDTSIANSFVGDPIAVDWDLDYKADSMYFGVIDGTAATSGRVMRLGVNEQVNPENWIAPATLMNGAQPVVASVTPGVDETGQKWIFFGTGRFFVSADQTSTATQSIYGVKEAGVEVVKADLLNVSNAQVATDGTLTGVGVIPTMAALEGAIATSYKGWYRELPPIEGVAGTAPATRVINPSALAGGVLFTTAYQPGVDACTGEGFSRLYGLYYKTGTAYSSPTVFGTETIADVEYSKAFIELGYGFATTPSLHSGSGTGDKAVSVFTQLSTGAIVRTEASTVTGVRSKLESWIELR